MNKLIPTLILGLFSFLLFLSCDSKESTASKIIQNPNLTTSTNTQHIRLKTPHGDIVFQLLPETAPLTCARIKELTLSGFYNGLSFHRVVKDFVIQTGDPTGTGRGGSGKKLRAEFSSLKHELGTVAMARSQDVNSADSQFYISLGAHSHLDEKYTVFGKVTSGFEILSKIEQGDKIIEALVE